MIPYIPRFIDAELDELAEAPALSIDGARGVGKTETALRRAQTVHRLDDPFQFAVLEAAPKRLVHGESPVLIDEWQRLPASWDLVRRAVDGDPVNSRFILTGSAAPNTAPVHSGAGRIISVRMRPLSIAERKGSRGETSLAAMLSGERASMNGVSEMGLEGYVEEIVRSGFPGIRGHPPRVRIGLIDGYLDLIVEHDVHEFGRRFRDRAQLRNWMAAYAAASATSASFETIRDAATPGQKMKPARSSTGPYRAALDRLWVIDELPAWLPGQSRLRALASASTHHMADPSLAARLLGADEDTLLAGRGAWIGNGPLLGALFESLVTQSVRVYAQAIGARAYHLRTHGGRHEIDLIVERADGRVVALEIKLGSTITGTDVRHLKWLAHQIGPRLLDSAVITTGPEAYRRRDGICVIPADLLGP